MSTLDRNDLLRFALNIGAGLILTYVSARIMKKLTDEIRNPRSKNEDYVNQLLLELQIPPDKLILTKHETDICSLIVLPSSIDVSWSDIAGLDKEISNLRESVIMPITCHELFSNSSSKLISFPKGVLLYGPPGCGKTMIAKATARESKCVLINVDMSMINDMYVGESPKFVKAIFSLAEKLNPYAPVIIFIDEVDTMLSSRKVTDHENSQLIKGTFMTHWDGIISSRDCRTVVMGATNKPETLDAAIYRRMPIRIPISLPNIQQRRSIFQKLLSKEWLDESVDFDLLSRVTKGLSGSDIKEFCSHSCMAPYREVFRNCEPSAVSSDNLRAVTMQDFVRSSQVVSPEVESRFRDEKGKGHIRVHGIYEDDLS